MLANIRPTTPRGQRTCVHLRMWFQTSAAASALTDAWQVPAWHNPVPHATLCHVALAQCTENTWTAPWEHRSGQQRVQPVRLLWWAMQLRALCVCASYKTKHNTPCAPAQTTLQVSFAGYAATSMISRVHAATPTTPSVHHSTAIRCTRPRNRSRATWQPATWQQQPPPQAAHM